jgi:hypothetical protein
MRSGAALGAVLLLAGSAHAARDVDSTYGIATAGLGGGYELFGASVGLHVDPLEAFVGVGAGTFLQGGMMGGLRFVHEFRRDDAWFVTVEGGHLIARSDADLFGNDRYELAVLGGVRISGEHVFGEFGIGPAMLFERSNGPRTRAYSIDFDLGVGVRF